MAGFFEQLLVVVSTYAFSPVETYEGYLINVKPFFMTEARALAVLVYFGDASSLAKGEFSSRIEAFCVTSDP